MRKILIYIIALWALSGGAALAVCPPLPTDLSYDHPLRQGADCAFDGGAENDVRGFYRARPAVDIGHGQVGQRLMSVTASCGGYTERVLVLDCVAGDWLALTGAPWPVNGPRGELPIGAAPAFLAENIQPPHGPIALGRGTSLGRLKDLARAHEIGWTSSLEYLRIGSRARNRFDLWCGCRRFYPNSAGAQK